MITNRKQAGDTIVEVLLCISILGMALGVGYMTIRANVKTNLSSQERLTASKLAQGQIEYLRASSLSLATLATNFCFSAGGGRYSNDPPNAQCVVNAVGTPTTQEPKYTLNITKSTTFADPSGAEYTIRVVWDDALGYQGNITYGYRLYRN